jgi:putative two-component system response regulator
VSGRRLLVIDDEPLIRELMIEILADAGHDVVGAETATAALELLRETDFELVISDIMMPGLSGLELLETLREIRPSLPVVLVTGAGTYQQLRDALTRGAGGLVLKPFTHGELIAAVDETLARNARWEHELRARLLTPTLASALANAIEVRDAMTGGHCERLAAVAVHLGERLGYVDGSLETLRLGAILHDVGKIGIPDRILLKRGPLDAEELRIMRTHPVVGDSLLEPLDLLARVRPIVRHHHERYDGGGYPDGLAGDAIPHAAQIVALADAVEAMASPRPYRNAMTLPAILRELNDGRGTQWDERIVDAMIELIRAREVTFSGAGAEVSADVAAVERKRVFSILLVEDNADHAALAVDVIEAAVDDVHVSHATDLASAKELCKGSVWSLAVVDYNLPDGTGLDAIESLHGAAPDLPILMLTGDDSTQVAVEAFRRGASDYVAKTNGYGEQLRDRVRALLKVTS